MSEYRDKIPSFENAFNQVKVIPPPMKRERNKLYVISISIALALVTVTAYEPVRLNGFVDYDDQTYVRENPNVYNGITYQSIIWAFTKIYKANWHPLTWLSHMLDCQIYGLNPLGHHITSLLIHITNSLLLFFLLSRMTGALWKSAFVAAAFALHPIHVESVAWVAERKDMLSGLFWILTLIAYMHYARSPNFRRYLLVLLTFVMGLMSKPMVVTLPFVLILLDYWPLGRLQPNLPKMNRIFAKFIPLKSDFQTASAWHLIKEKIPLFFLSAGSCIITLISQTEAMTKLEDLPIRIRIVNSVGSYFNYIVKILYPKGLAVLYPIPERAQVATAALAVLGVAVLLILWMRGRDRRWLVVGLLWYLGTLVPVIGLVHVGKQLMADRYTYLPSIGIFIIVAWGAGEILSKIRYSRVITVCGTAAILTAMVIMTRIQVGYWQNNLTLFGRTVAVTRDNYVMHTNYGEFLCVEGRYDEGAWHFKEAIRIFPGCLAARGNLCRTLLVQGKVEEAITCITKELQEEKDWPDIYLMYKALGSAYELKGELDLAEINYKKALTDKPEYESGLKSLRELFIKEDKLDEAVVYFNELLQQNKDSVKIHNSLAMVLSTQGDYDDAIKHFARVLELNPGYPDAHTRMGQALAAAGRTKEAIAQFKEAMRTSTNIAEVYANLGSAYDQLGKYDLALQNWIKIIELDPNNPGALNNAAWLLVTADDVSTQDIKRAIEFAERACEQTEYKNPETLDTLAAAYAAAGRFDDAAQTAEKAINFAQAQDKKELTEKIRKRLQSYLSEASKLR